MPPIYLNLLLLLNPVALAEAFDLPVGVEFAHGARPERMALGRDFELDDRDLDAIDLPCLLRGLGRTPHPLVAGRSVDGITAVESAGDVIARYADAAGLSVTREDPRVA